MHEIYVHMVDTGMVDLYPNVGRAYKLALTLPASSCSCEWSFSALKFVKNALRSTMLQSCLSDLMVSAVQAEKMQSHDLKEIVEIFWNSVQWQ